MPRRDSYDLILVGTGFASSFFLAEALRRLGPRSRVLVLERGARHEHGEYLRRRHDLARRSLDQVVIPPTDKPWIFLLAFGGSSNCWWANTPRMLPADFELRTRFGVGRDWPVRYDDLEEHYCRAEELMEIAGPADNPLAPRSRPYPQPAHRLSEPDRLFHRAYPDRFFALPSARASRPASGRPPCCGNGVCAACPTDSKFTVANGLAQLYRDPRVVLELEARADAVEISGGVARGVRYTRTGRERVVSADLVVLGANGIFNPHLLLRSGLRHPALGRGLVEQVSVYAVVYLDGVDNFQGSTSRCGAGYMLHGDRGRAERAAALILTHNTWDITGLRTARGKWRRILGLTMMFEDLRDDDNRVVLSSDDPSRPVVDFRRRSGYALRGLDALAGELPQLLAPLPTEGFRIFPDVKPTDAHIIGTTVMGDDPANSVLDRHLIHHEVRNLVVLGSGAFPTAAPANPTLTLSALSLWSAAAILPAPGGRSA
jgi:choline dehydrogenase-like flavoprotein